jgi:KDEL-tailed cysteine endopeptidase
VTGFFLFGRQKPTPTPSAIKNVYNQWKAQYNIKVGAAEDDYRLRVFTQNYELINSHNKIQGASYKLGLNPYAHLTNVEFSATHLGFTKKQVSAPKNATTCDNKGPLTLPASVDWNATGQVSQVKNQGQCGSCWAFSAIGAVESVLAITTGQVIEFSEQQLVDCSTSYGNEGCNGGLMNLAFQYVTDNGIVQESDYPYKAADQTCNVPAGVATARISGYRNVTANSSDTLMSAVAKNPVSVAVEADSSVFQLYKSGVVTSDACGTNLNHGVLVVGYGIINKQEFWLVKNSWGPAWGDQGYIRIQKDKSGSTSPGVCGINLDASYPTHYC